MEELKRFWLDHGEYKSSLEACKDARANGFMSETLAEMVNLYREMYPINE